MNTYRNSWLEVQFCRILLLVFFYKSYYLIHYDCVQFKRYFEVKKKEKNKKQKVRRGLM